MQVKHDICKPILWFSLPLAALLALSAIVAISTPEFYAAETANWQAQSIGQDMVNLYLVLPCLLLSAWLASKNKKGFAFIWAGVVSYLLYTFIIYCFAVHFNRLFLVYCFALGLCFFSLLWFFYAQLRRSSPRDDHSLVPRKLIAFYFIILSIVFYFLWLSEIIPAIATGETPLSVKETGLITNAVHVLDLSVFLPLVFISGIFLLQKNVLGYIMAPLLLTFFILMNITIGWLIILMKQRGAGGEYPVAVAMGVLTIFSLILLVSFIKKIRKAE